MTSTTSVFFVKITGGGEGSTRFCQIQKKKIAQITDICFLEIYLVTMTILKP